MNLAYDDRGGTGDPVLFIAGRGGAGRTWHLHQVPAFQRAGYRCITFDNRGIGATENAIGFATDQVSVPVKANVYFDGKVVSHTLLHADGSKQTLGLIQPGEHVFFKPGDAIAQLIDHHVAALGQVHAPGAAIGGIAAAFSCPAQSRR